MLVIGLTGGIGSGKTQVSKFLQEFGATVIDADRLGHEIYAPKTEAWYGIVATFGEDVLAPTGEIDREKLGAIVFSDPNALRQLNAIVHPDIRRAIVERVRKIELADKDSVVVIEAALLVEANWTDLTDEIWVTTSSEDEVIRRIRARSNLDTRAIKDRIHSQISHSERVKYADVIISNSGNFADLKHQIKQLWEDKGHVYKEGRSQI